MSMFRQVAAVAVFFVLIGLGVLTGATVLFIQTHSFIATATSAPGVVVDLEPSKLSSGRTCFYSVFTFADKNGQTHKCRTTFASNPAPFKIGSEVTVLYQADDPEMARLRSFHTLWLMPTILCGLGFASLTAGAAAFIAARKTYGNV